MNFLGSCGYVGIDMLLSYYDTYLNDNIVPERYDQISEGNCYNMLCRRNSPGSRFDQPKDFDIDEYGEDDEGILRRNTDYYNYMYQQRDISLHAKLLTLGHALGYYDYNDETPASVNHKKMKQIIKKYMYDVLGFNDGNEYRIYDIKDNLINDSDDVRNFVIEKISLGIPVLLSIKDEDGEGHWVIAYEYDNASDKIYCNFGWGGDATHITPENYKEELYINDPKMKNFNTYSSAISIEFDIPHVHSNNYAVTSVVDGEEVTHYYCYDSQEIELLSNAFISSSHSLEHKILFECGHFFIQESNWSMVSDEIGHIFTCRYCLYQIIESHSCYDYDCSNIMHSGVCTSCGYVFMENHTFEHRLKDNVYHLDVCVECGYERDFYHSFEYAYTNESTHTRTCSICGYTNVTNHYFVYRSVSANYHVLTCMYCGTTTGDNEHHSWTTYSPQYVRCQYCSHLKSKEGNIIIPVLPNKDDDPEEETE